MPIIQPGFRLINKYTLSIVLIFVIAIIIIKSTGDTSKKEDEKLIRPVRVVKVAHKIAGQSLSLTGEILAKNEIDLSFRIDGKLIERLVSIGEGVTPGQIVARLDPQDVKDNLTAAKSNLNAAQAALDQATSNEARQKILLSKGVVTNAKYEDALSQLQSAQAKVEGAEANLNQAQNRVEYTNLKVDTAGIVTAVKAEAGEIVRAGQAVMRIATNEGRDAVFNVPEQLFQNKPSTDQFSVEVSLSHDPNIKTTGIVREVSPQADPVSRTFTVKVGLKNPPEALKLGSTVTGSVTLNKGSAIELPVMSLNKSNSSPAVWVVNPENNTVSLRDVKIIGYNQDSVIISDGLESGELVVTAGVHSLYPGQQVKILEK
ncbi:MAG: efflux RND transporter periplasmic adaptor subunit [Rickettsiaceae bacterium]|nr:efflux RND transporter periplasmic adaptor subunit [Rickettsiaceae bacterium]